MENEFEQEFLMMSADEQDQFLETLRSFSNFGALMITTKSNENTKYMLTHTNIETMESKMQFMDYMKFSKWIVGKFDFIIDANQDVIELNNGAYSTIVTVINE